MITRTRVVLAVGLLVACVLATIAVILPRMVKARIIAAAATHGVALGIDDLSLAPGRARLRGVRASPLIRSDAKGGLKATATADTVDVALDGLTPTAITVRGVKLVLDGSVSDVQAALTPRDRGAASASPLASVRLEDASLEWTHALGSGSSIGARFVFDATHVKADVTRKASRSLGDDWHVETAALRLFDDKSPPWSVTADNDDKGLRVALGAPKGARLAIGVAPSGARRLDVDTPEVSPTDLGLPPAVLGLVGDETSRFELHLHHHEPDAKHGDGTVVLAAKDVYLGPATHRTSFSLDARYAGDPRTSLAVTQGTLRAGPFTGSLTGDFAVDPTAGLRASLRYASGVMSCIDAVKSQAAGYGDLGKGVVALAGMLGLDQAVEGRISLKGSIEIAPSAAPNVSFRTEGDCKLSYLPSL